MKRAVRMTLIVFIITSCLAALAWAESATKEDAIAKCEDAARRVQEKGVDAGALIIGDKTGPYVWKDAYVFLMDLDGMVIAHPKGRITSPWMRMARSHLVPGVRRVV